LELCGYYGIVSDEGNEPVCCAKTCGQCGGSKDCLALDGGMNQCCVEIIKMNAIPCNGRNTGCVLPRPPTLPSTTPTVTMTSSLTSTDTSTATSTAITTEAASGSGSDSVELVNVRKMTAKQASMAANLSIMVAAVGAIFVLVGIAVINRTFNPVAPPAPTQINVVENQHFVANVAAASTYV